MLCYVTLRYVTLRYVMLCRHVIIYNADVYSKDLFQSHSAQLINLGLNLVHRCISDLRESNWPTPPRL